MNTRSLIFFVLYLLVLSESTSYAQVPSLINYQGRLADANGAPVTGSKNFVIRLYDAQTGGRCFTPRILDPSLSERTGSTASSSDLREAATR